nr:hypothetical protein [Nostoc sp. ChiSLP03a]MDZ8215425.1 hypothetical protein [Nostoc sp. ChiSLP03a]
MNRAEHLSWCKQRALQYLDLNDPEQAWTSFLSDMTKHDELKNHPALTLGIRLLISGHIAEVSAMRKFIQDFN